MKATTCGLDRHLCDSCGEKISRFSFCAMGDQLFEFCKKCGDELLAELNRKRQKVHDENSNAIEEEWKT